MAFAGNIPPGYYFGIDYTSGPSWTAYIEQKKMSAYKRLKEAMRICAEPVSLPDIYPHPQQLTHTYEFKVVRMSRNEFRLFSRSIWRYHGLL
jgi:hypothetical protein